MARRDNSGALVVLLGGAAWLWYRAAYKSAPGSTAYTPQAPEGGATTAPPETVGTVGFAPLEPAPPAQVGPLAPAPTEPGGLDLASPEPDQVVVLGDPTPGYWYRIKAGDSLLTVAGAAYNSPTKGERLTAARRINTDPWNQANAKYYEASGSTYNLFGLLVITFLPPYQIIRIPEAL